MFRFYLFFVKFWSVYIYIEIFRCYYFKVIKYEIFLRNYKGVKVFFFMFSCLFFDDFDDIEFVYFIVIILDLFI